MHPRDVARVFAADSHRLPHAFLGYAMGPGYQDSLRGKASAHLGSGMTRGLYPKVMGSVHKRLNSPFVGD